MAERRGESTLSSGKAFSVLAWNFPFVLGSDAGGRSVERMDRFLVISVDWPAAAGGFGRIVIINV